MRTSRLIVAPVVLLAGALALTACASSQSTGGSTADSSAAASSANVGGDPSTWTPQVVNPGATTLVKGQFAMLDGLADIPETEQIRVTTSDENVIFVTQSGPDVYAAIEAKGVGSATVEVFVIPDAASKIPASEKPVATYDFTVEAYQPSAADTTKAFDDQPLMGADPSTWAPVMITQDVTEVSLTDHQFAIIDTAPVPYDDSILITPSKAGVVAVVDQGPQNYGLIQAKAEGSVDLTITDTDGAGDIMHVKVVVKPLPQGVSDSL